MNKLFFNLLLAASLACGAVYGQNIVQTYRNPVIPGALPDPSIIRVGNDYYAAGTSGDMAPNYPLYHSRDLVNWERIGAIFNTPPEWISGACWAPELYYRDGTFYAYYTAKRRSDGVSCIGVAMTKDITKGFKDYGVLIEWGTEAIDAFIFLDDNGKQYITWKAYGLDARPIEILACELDKDGVTLIGSHFTLTAHDKGWKGYGDEGQCIVKRNGYYYFFYSIGSCCEPKCDYRVDVARAKDLRGPWEQYSGNSILQGGEMWKCSGHGTLVQSPDGRWFYLYHAFQTYDFELVGRQALLDEMLWDDKTGWPYFKYGRTPSAQAEVPFPGTVQKRDTRFHDDFTSDENDKYWIWDMKSPLPALKKENGWLLFGSAKPGVCFRGVNAITGNYLMETQVAAEGNGFKGLSVYGGARSYFAWGVENGSVKLYKTGRGGKTEVFSQPVTAKEIFLRVEAQNSRILRFYWSEDNTKWTAVSPDGMDGSFLSRAGGVSLGLMIDNVAESARFAYFTVNSKF